MTALVAGMTSGASTAVSRRASLGRCPACRGVILTGLDDDRCGLLARVDPAPLTTVGEVAALLAGRWTYDARLVDGRVRLDHRDQWKIRVRPWPVLASHACPGVVPDFGWLPTPARADDPTEVPF